MWKPYQVLSPFNTYDAYQKKVILVYEQFLPAVLFQRDELGEWWVVGGTRGWRVARRGGESPAGAGRSQPPGGRRGQRGTRPGWTEHPVCLQRRREAKLAALLHVSAFHSGSHRLFPFCWFNTNETLYLLSMAPSQSKHWAYCHKKWWPKRSDLVYLHQAIFT